MAKFTASCAGKLRKEKSVARKLHVFVQTNPHRPTDPQYFQSVTFRLPVASNITTELIRYSLHGLDLIFKPGYLYQKAGVVVLDLIPQQVIQMGLFEGGEWRAESGREKQMELMKAVDEVNKVLGKDRVRLGVQDYGSRWRLKQEHMSPSWTTRFEQLPKAKAG